MSKSQRSYNALDFAPDKIRNVSLTSLSETRGPSSARLRRAGCSSRLCLGTGYARETLGLGNIQILADLVSSKVDNLTVPWNRRRFLGAAIDVDRVIAAFAQEFAAVVFKVSNEIKPSCGRNREGFTQNLGSMQRLFRQFAIRLQNHLNRFL